MERLNAAVIGTGTMGSNHARVYSELNNTELVAVSDIREENSSQVAENLKCNSYRDYGKMLRREKIDLISIAVPTRNHKKVAMDCIENGIPALIEKPIADTVENAMEIIKKSGKENVPVMIGHIERFNPAVLELKNRLDEIGRIFSISAKRVGPFPERIRDVGVTIDLATHDIDIMLHLMNSNIKRIYAEAGYGINTKYEDILTALLRFENDAIGALSVNWLTPEKSRELSVTGEKGMFLLNYLTQELYLYENPSLNDNGYNYSEMMMGLSQEVKKIKIRKREPLRVELEKWVEYVKDGGALPVSLDDGLSVLGIANKIIESSRRGEVLSL